MPRLPLVLSLSSMLAAASAAQCMPVPDADGRMLQLFDLSKLHPDAAGHGDVSRFADMLRPFVQPALGPGDDLRGLGERWLAMLGSPEQIACIERLFQVARAHAEDTVRIEVRFVEFPAGAFHEHVEPLMSDARDGHLVLDKEAGARLLAACAGHGEQVMAPRLESRLLSRCSVEICNQIAFVKDYQLKVAHDTVVADPVIDTVWSGQKSDVSVLLLPNGNIGLRCDIRQQHVDEPLAKADVSPVPGLPPVQVQLPRVTGVHLESVAELATGSLLAVVQEEGDGKFLLATVAVERTEAR